MVEWSYEVLSEIKVVMVHIRGQYQGTWATTVLVELFRMGKWNQIVFHAMHQKGWTGYGFDLFEIVESVLYQEFQNLASLVFGNRAN